MKYILHVNSTYNNTLLNLTDVKGNTIIWESSGKNKFKGSKKSTSFASQISAEKIAKYLRFKKILVIDIRIKGVGLGRDSVLRTINNFGIKIRSINDVTPLPHNGCRPPKKRRT